MPLVMMLTSHPKVAKPLYNHNPSFNRNFIYRSVDFLEENEVRDFFTKIFKSENIEIDSDALKLMVEFTAGSPTMMQSIGDEIYWLCNDGCVSKEIALKGINQSINEIEKRYLLETFKEYNMSENDSNILKVLGKRFIDNGAENYYFKFDDIKHELSKMDEEIYSDFIKKSLDCGIIEVKNSDEYEFSNDLYPIYFAIKT